MPNETDITHHTARVNGIRMHYVVAGAGPPVFLLHGFPEFWYAWRHQIPALARRYTVVAPDLRGYGYSDKPRAGYDKRTMATDIRELAARLGFGRFAVVGHDRGARVAFCLVKDAPGQVSRPAARRGAPPLSPVRAWPGRRPRSSSPALDLGLTLVRPARKDEKRRPFPNWLGAARRGDHLDAEEPAGAQRHGGRVPAGLWVRIVQRLLALNAAIWHNWQIGAPVKRSLIAYDHF